MNSVVAGSNEGGSVSDLRASVSTGSRERMIRADVVWKKDGTYGPVDRIGYGLVERKAREGCGEYGGWCIRRKARWIIRRSGGVEPCRRKVRENGDHCGE